MVVLERPEIPGERSPKMRYIQIIFSPVGGTARTAEIMTSMWSESVETVDLTDPSLDFSKYSFEKEDTVLVAMPSYGGRVPEPAALRLSRIKGNSASCVLLCVYGNRAYEDTLVEMQDIARECGFRVVAAVAAVAEHSIMHQYATGRPDGADAKQLTDFAAAIQEKIEKGAAGEEPVLPGNRPYKKYGGVGLVPKPTKDCVNCGMCAARCPAQAISRDNSKNVDSGKCISCMRCTAECPGRARKVMEGIVAVAALKMKKVCSVRKECELFI